MDKKAVVHIHNGILLSYWKESIWISFNKVDETRAYYTEWSKSERKTPMQYINTYICNLERWWWWPYTWDSKRDTDIKKTGFWTLREVRVGWFEGIALKHVHYHMWNRWPVQVWCMKQGNQSWCTGTIQRNGMGREVGGVLGLGAHVHPWLIHINVWQKPPQYCKAIASN